MLTDPKTREQLVGWEDVHAPALVAQLRAALIERPADRALQQLVERVVESSSFLRRRPPASRSGTEHDPEMLISAHGLVDQHAHNRRQGAPGHALT